MVRKKHENLIVRWLFVTLGLSYLFWVPDAIPDNSIPILGLIDDAIVVFVLWIVHYRINKK